MSHDEIVITLYENHYDQGVAALANSLVKSGFEGLLLVGYRGALPQWINQLDKTDNESLRLSEKILIQFQYLDTKLHFGYYKPFFLKETSENYLSAKRFYYFDPDIVVNAPWTFFSEWVNNGIALCLDNCFPIVHHNHPWRKGWLDLASLGPEYHNKIDYYVNSGFIGITKENMPIVYTWIDLTQKYAVRGGLLTTFNREEVTPPIKTDQDLLNAAITISQNLIVSIIGKEGMGFAFPAYLMTHAVNPIKPWKKNFLHHLVKTGQKPSFAEKNYFNYCEFPITIFPQKKFFLKKVNIKIASMLGRFIGY